jgi:hypothetical protein
MDNIVREQGLHELEPFKKYGGEFKWKLKKKRGNV